MVAEHRSATASPHSTDLLLRRIREGDESAKAELLQRVMPALERWASGRIPQRCRSLTETSDLVQISVIRAVARVEQFESRHPGAFFAYLRRILLNALKEVIAQQRKSGEAVTPDSVESELIFAGSGLEGLVGRDNLIAYEQALATLSDDQQALMFMRFELGMSYVEIGSELQEAADTVRIRLGRTLNRMMALMDS